MDFYADWCGPCQTLEPVLEDVTQHYKNRLTVLRIDVDKYASLAKRFLIQSVPTLILYKNNLEIWRCSGLISKKELIKLLDKQLV